MKLAIILNDSLGGGGIPNVMRSIAFELSRKNEVHLFCTKNTKIKNVIIHKIYTTKFKILSLLYFAVVSKIITRKGYDITIGSSFHAFNPNIIIAHSCYKSALGKWRSIMHNYPNINERKIRISDYLAVLIEYLNFRFGKYRRIVCVSEEIKNEIIREFNVKPNKIRVIPNGVDLNKFNTKDKINVRSLIRQKYGIKNKEKIILLVGTPFLRKGLFNLIRSLPHVKNHNFKLIAIGKGDVKYYGHLAKTFGVSDKIIFVTNCNNPEDFYFASDLFVFPSFYEGFPLVILEAMASGVPIIINKDVVSDIYFKDSKNIFTIDNIFDEKEIAEKINLLLSNNGVCDRLKKNNKGIIGEFDWEKTSSLYLKEIKKISPIL